MTRRRWQLLPRTEPTVVAQLLKNRDIQRSDQFFTPDYNRDSHDPFLMPGMQEAVTRITRALSAGEKICVFGDYDADGIPGTALLIKTLQSNQANVMPYIPDREKEGYGLNTVALEYLKQQGVQLIITVDLGITNRDQVAAAHTAGMEVIVTDHHEIDPERLPTDALTIVHPRLEGSKYPFGWLAGGGVAWKLAQALAVTTGTPNTAQLKWWLELPSISTVCDMVPLIDENRMIVHYGLKVLMQTRNPGLQALYRAGGIAHDALTERTIGYQIGPRINAPGRIDHASLALELLLSNDEQQVVEYAAKIEQQNRERQEQLDFVTQAATEMVERDKLDANAALVLAGTDWPHGVLGLAASRIVERFHRPTIVLSGANGVLKGSGRSIDAFNLLEAIVSQKDLLLSYGGHEKAAGLSLEQNNLKAFTEGLLMFARAKLTDDALIPSSRADLLLQPQEINEGLVTELLRFAPYGMQNPKPRFVIAPLTVSASRTVGAANKHLKLRFQEGPPAGGLEGIGFGLGNRTSITAPGSRLAVLGSLEFNVWNGVSTIQVMIDDLKTIDEAKADGIL